MKELHTVLPVAVVNKLRTDHVLAGSNVALQKAVSRDVERMSRDSGVVGKAVGSSYETQRCKRDSSTLSVGKVDPTGRPEDVIVFGDWRELRSSGLSFYELISTDINDCMLIIGELVAVEPLTESNEAPSGAVHPYKTKIPDLGQH
jgi:hypothetical protein